MVEAVKCGEVWGGTGWFGSRVADEWHSTTTARRSIYLTNAAESKCHRPPGPRRETQVCRTSPLASMTDDVCLWRIRTSEHLGGRRTVMEAQVRRIGKDQSVRLHGRAHVRRGELTRRLSLLPDMGLEGGKIHSRLWLCEAVLQVLQVPVALIGCGAISNGSTPSRRAPPSTPTIALNRPRSPCHASGASDSAIGPLLPKRNHSFQHHLTACQIK
jgi:hypothetical protein